MQLLSLPAFALVGAALAYPATVPPTYTRSEEASAQVAAPETAPCNFTKETRYGIADVMLGWGEIWRGDWRPEIIEKTVMPDISLYQDRMPLGNGSTAPLPIHNVDQLLSFIMTSHQEFSEYNIIDQFNFVSPEGDKVAARWTLEGTIAENSTSPTRQPGDVISVNGTDIVLFDECSGRISQVLTAQDGISFNYQMGYDLLAR